MLSKELKSDLEGWYKLFSSPNTKEFALNIGLDNYLSSYIKTIKELSNFNYRLTLNNKNYSKYKDIIFLLQELNTLHFEGLDLSESFYPDINPKFNGIVFFTNCLFDSKTLEFLPNNVTHISVFKSNLELDLSRFKDLTNIILYGCNLNSIPKWLLDLPKLKNVNLSNNNISVISEQDLFIIKSKKYNLFSLDSNPINNNETAKKLFNEL